MLKYIPSKRYLWRLEDGIFFDILFLKRHVWFTTVPFTFDIHHLPFENWSFSIIYIICICTAVQLALATEVSPVLNPISAGVLENQDMLGGPSKSHVYVQIWQIIHHWKALLCSTFRICKKICKFAKIECFIAKSSYKEKCLQKNLSINEKF